MYTPKKVKKIKILNEKAPDVDLQPKYYKAGHLENLLYIKAIVGL